MNSRLSCSDCDSAELLHVDRRRFVQSVGAGVAAASAGLWPTASHAEGKTPKSETLVQKLYASLSDEQKSKICFDWDRLVDGDLLRTHVEANWHITEPTVSSSFFTGDQQEMIETIYFGLYNPDWHSRVRKQLQDDADGYGKRQSIAIFGQPGSGKFQFVMTGRHLTIRCDGDSEEHVAFGGPIFYGHAAGGFNEPADHAGNVFWDQALKANALYKMLDGKQRAQALIDEAPEQSEVHFRKKKSAIPGLRLAELSKDQHENVEKVLASLLEPYRESDRKEASTCLKAQGGLDECRISFYKSDDVGEDGVWDVWRLEGPSFVWHYRGDPHVHVWVNVADDPNVKIST